MFLALRNRYLHDGDMVTAGTPATETSNPGQAPADDDQRRWEEMLASLAALLPDRSRCVLVDGPAEQAGLFATRLAGELSARARPVHVVVDASAPWDSVIFLRTAPGGRHFPVYRKDTGHRKEPDERGRREREERADIVIDLHDIRWPVIRRGLAVAARRRLSTVKARWSRRPAR